MNDGATPLFIASQNGYIEVTRCLVEKSADVNQASHRPSGQEVGQWDPGIAWRAEGSSAREAQQGLRQAGGRPGPKRGGGWG
eukprot:12808544-Alexandrium_andersonii.AAC.1